MGRETGGGGGLFRRGAGEVDGVGGASVGADEGEADGFAGDEGGGYLLYSGGVGQALFQDTDVRPRELAQREAAADPGEDSVGVTVPELLQADVGGD